MKLNKTPLVLCNMITSTKGLVIGENRLSWGRQKLNFSLCVSITEQQREILSCWNIKHRSLSTAQAKCCSERTSTAEVMGVRRTDTEEEDGMGGDVSSSTSTASLPLRSLLCRLQRDRKRIKLLPRKHQHSRTRSARAALQDDDYYYIIIIERRDIQTEDVYLTGRQLVFCMCVISTEDEEDSVHRHKSNIYTHTSIFLRSLRIWSDDVTIEIPSSSPSARPIFQSFSSRFPRWNLVLSAQQMREELIKLWTLCAHLISYVEVSGDMQSERKHDSANNSKLKESSDTFCVSSGWNKTYLISVFIYN